MTIRIAAIEVSHWHALSARLGMTSFALRACVEAWWMGCKEPGFWEKADGQGSLACRL